jgi:hypothetical protein
MPSPVDPFEVTPRELPPAESGSSLAALPPASSSPSRSVRGHFGKAIVAAAFTVESYQWVWGHAFDKAPWWGAPLALCLTMLPFGVWERLGTAAIAAVAEKFPGAKR